MTENKNFNREQQGQQQKYGQKEQVQDNKQQPRKQEDKNLRQTQGGSCPSCGDKDKKNPQGGSGHNQPRR